MRTKLSQRAGGFTLVELLVVIGIIAVLIGILVPTVTSVKKAARKADTKGLLTNIASSIEAYRAQFSAYPGAVSNRDLLAGGNGVLVYNLYTPKGAGSTTSLNLDSSNNLVLALSGGLGLDLSNGHLEFDRQYVGRGPVSLNPNAPKALGVFKEVNDSGLFYPGANTFPYYADKYTDPQPILYVRANPGKTADGDIAHEIGAGTPAQSVVYDTRLFVINGNAITPNSKFGGTWENYLKNSSQPTQAVNRDSYVLISAGEDGILGTPDDVTNYGTPGGE